MCDTVQEVFEHEGTDFVPSERFYQLLGYKMQFGMKICPKLEQAIKDGTVKRHNVRRYGQWRRYYTLS